MAAPLFSAARGRPPDPRLHLRAPDPLNFHSFPRLANLGMNRFKASSSASIKASPSLASFPVKGSVASNQFPPRQIFNKSFVDVAKSRVVTQQLSTHFGDMASLPGAQITSDNGEQVVVFDDEITNTLAGNFKWSLVGKFAHGVPPKQEIGKFFSSFKFAGKYELKWLNPRQLLMAFYNIDDYTRVWTHGICNVGGFPMRLIKWSPLFDSKVESAFVPVWVKLPGLPAHLYERRALFLLASRLGKPLKVDYATAKRSNFFGARICVEIDLQAPRVDHIVLKILGKRRVQKVVYENLPKFCSFCSHIGHGLEACYVKNNKLNPGRKKKRTKNSNSVMVSKGQSNSLGVFLRPSSSSGQNFHFVNGCFFEDVHGSLVPLLSFNQFLGVDFSSIRLSSNGGIGLNSSIQPSNCLLLEYEEGEIIDEDVIGDAPHDTISNINIEHLAHGHAQVDSSSNVVKYGFEGSTGLANLIVDAVDFTPKLVGCAPFSAHVNKFNVLADEGLMNEVEEGELVEEVVGEPIIAHAPAFQVGFVCGNSGLLPLQGDLKKPAATAPEPSPATLAVAVLTNSGMKSNKKGGKNNKNKKNKNNKNKVLMGNKAHAEEIFAETSGHEIVSPTLHGNVHDELAACDVGSNNEQVECFERLPTSCFTQLESNAPVVVAKPLVTFTPEQEVSVLSYGYHSDVEKRREALNRESPRYDYYNNLSCDSDLEYDDEFGFACSNPVANNCKIVDYVPSSERRVTRSMSACQHNNFLWDVPMYDSFEDMRALACHKRGKSSSPRRSSRF